MPESFTQANLFALIAVTALVTYLLRVVPLVALRRPLKNPVLVALLEYMPYALLAAMIFPDVLYATDEQAAFPGTVPAPSLVGTLVALVLSVIRPNLPFVACMATLAAYLTLRLCS